jgi:hypothetical protein
VEKTARKFCATSVIFKILPKVSKRPIGEKSPNLVTLLSSTRMFFEDAFFCGNSTLFHIRFLRVSGSPGLTSASVSVEKLKFEHCPQGIAKAEFKARMANRNISISPNRATRVGEFSPNGWLLTLGSF